MSFKKSFSNTEKNKETWAKNLVQFQAPSRRSNVAIYEAPLSERSRIPLKNHVIGRFKFLESTAKERRERIDLIAVELKDLWSKTLNFPHVSDQAICVKLAKLLKDYERCRKKQNFDSLNELFDMTVMKGEWLCKEDENLYKLQIESKCHGKPASANTIHPSKRKRATEATVPTLASSALPDCSESSTDSSENSTDSPWEDDNAASMFKRIHNPTGIARRLVTCSKLLSHGAAVVCRQLSGEGIEILTPCQSAIHKAIYTRAV